jgi:uncharacterized protein (DUF885 family)
MNMRLSFAALLLATTAAACTTTAKTGAPATAAAQPSARAEDQRLLAFLDQAFDEAVALSPESLTGLGIKQDYDKLDSYTDAQADRELALSERQLARMKADFAYDRLSAEGQLNYRLFENGVERQRRMHQWRTHRFPISSNSSPAGQIPVFLINQHKVNTVADAEAYVSRLREVERVMNEVSARVRDQADRGIVPPKFIFAPVRADAKKVLVGAPFSTGPDSTVLADFRKKVDALDAPGEVKARLLADASAALTGPFKRGYDVMLAALDAIEPKARGNDGAWSLPDGEGYYNNQLFFSTTTDLTADQIHQIGLGQVAAIEADIAAIKDKVGFQGSLQDFFNYIRTDARFKFPNNQEGREQYLADARRYIAGAMEAAPRYFHRLPKAPLEVRAVEAWRQDTASIAFYERPTEDGSRPGIFYANLADMSQVQKHRVENTSYHEGAPGHHFQIARAQELEGLPKFRRFGFYGAYIEGWGLYAERLAKEMGFYQDPYQEIGMLSARLWRAVRLVTDTGLHAKRWSRDQAIDYFRKHTTLSERDLVREVDRYINNPGQATSYMIGMLKIMELRTRAEQALGAKFDIRDFHEVILGSGPLPLDVLEQQVDLYIAARKAA